MPWEGGCLGVRESPKRDGGRPHSCHSRRPPHQAWGIPWLDIQYPGIRRGSPGPEVMDTQPLRPDCRRFVCDRCHTAVYICSWCDRGHRYCSSRCRQQARRRSLREAGQRYQQSRRGRRLHAQRQASYRRRQRARLGEKVTHHRCRPVSGSASVISCETTPKRSDTSPAGQTTMRHDASQAIVCSVCGHPCEPFVRDDFLRCRRL